MTRKAPFGKTIRQDHFLFAPSHTPLNHGSYGAYPRAIQEEVTKYQKEAHERPDVFIVYKLPKLIDSSRAVIAPLLGVPADEVVFVPNATTGINTVLRNLVYKDGDVIVYFSTIYDSCEKTIESLEETSPVRGVSIPLVYPLEDDEVVSRLQNTIARLRGEGKNAKVAMFDTVLTFPGVRVPWERLVECCRKLKVLSCVDGAHGIGHLDLTHLGEVGPDFFVSNCHKWLYTPRGCAVFHVPKRNQHLIRTTVPTSYRYRNPSEPPVEIGGKSQFVYQFEFVATIDHIPYVCVPAALSFRREICGGESRIREYCYNLAFNGGKRVAEILGTELMTNQTRTLNQCCFANIRLPLVFENEGKADDTSRRFAVRDLLKIRIWLNEKGVREFDTYLQVNFCAGWLWVRLSAQIYLDLTDFEWIGGVLKGLCTRLNSGERYDEEV